MTLDDLTGDRGDDLEDRVDLAGVADLLEGGVGHAVQAKRVGGGGGLRLGGSQFAFGLAKGGFALLDLGAADATRPFEQLAGTLEVVAGEGDRGLRRFGGGACGEVVGPAAGPTRGCGR